MFMNEEVIRHLNFLCRTYDGVVKLSVQTQNRLHSLNPDYLVKSEELIKEMDSRRGKIARRIEKELEHWDIWNHYLLNVPGIGPAIGGKLILLYYYRMQPACKECGSSLERKEGTFYCEQCDKSVKGEGNLVYAIQIRDFPMISSWWHFMGRHVVDGKVPKRAKGVVCDWSTPGRQVGYQIGQSFIKAGPDHLYRQFYDQRRALREKTHPDESKLHKMNMALNETVKMFLSHFWQVARTIEGLPLTEPYIVAKDPIHKLIPPYYWQPMELAA